MKMNRPKTVPAYKKLVKVGNYELTGKLLGKGNFARVEEAVHKLLKTKVAMKIIDTSKIKEAYVIRNLEREGRIMSNLSHPCIAALYETIKCGNVYYLITELAAGGDMRCYIKAQKHGRLDERTTRGFARQVISAIGHMHSRGIVHRDLKMENIMVASNKMQIKIVDFGLSNIWTVESPLKTHCGSPEYAAPELFLNGRSYGPEVDLWSLGVILYGMMTGRLPFISLQKEAITSQEKRQRLLAQINRGLTDLHRKELEHSSSDFQNLISKLLMPCSTTRIKTESVLLHPWVTQRQTKIIKITSLGPSDPYWQSIVFNNIATLLGLDSRWVAQEIERNRFGEIGGVYNIQQHFHFLHNKEFGENSVLGNQIASKRVSPSSLKPSVRSIKIGCSNKSLAKVTVLERQMQENSSFDRTKEFVVKRPIRRTQYSSVHSSNSPEYISRKVQKYSSSIPVPINSDHLHSIRYPSRKSTSLQSNPKKPLVSMETHSLESSINHRPATVHPRLKPQENRTEEASIHKNRPTSIEKLTKWNRQFDVLGRGDHQDTSKIQGSSLTLKKSSRIAKSIAEYVKNLSQMETKSNRLSKLKRALDYRP